MDNPIRLDDGTEGRFKDKYPLGLAPQFAGEVTDWSITTGWRTERDLGDGYSLTADLSARYGWDKIAYSKWDTVNPSMGRIRRPNSPPATIRPDKKPEERRVRDEGGR